MHLEMKKKKIVKVNRGVKKLKLASGDVGSEHA